MVNNFGIKFLPLKETRYDRHDLISWWDQKKLSNTRVIVAGAGALGNEVLKLLALIGVGQITVIDFDVVTLSNLSRMVLFREADVGNPKVEVAVARMKEINPEVMVRGIQGDLRFDLGLGDYRSADIVFGCLDSVNARWALNRKCFQAGVNWLDGGISDHHGQVAHYSGKTGACYECNFTPSTIERFNRRYSCPFGLANSQNEEKVPTTAITTSVIAAIQVQQALLWLHGQEQESIKPGQRLMIYLKPFRMIVDRLPYNPACLAHDPIPHNIELLDFGNDAIIREVIQAAANLLPGICALELPFDLVTYFTCSNCGNNEKVNRPKEKVYQEELRCPECYSQRNPQMVTEITVGDPVSELTLQEINIPSREILSFRVEERNVYFQLGH
jgi:molybdopterin/thiamine biosynthesis adenylyltransferase